MSGGVFLHHHVRVNDYPLSGSLSSLRRFKYSTSRWSNFGLRHQRVQDSSRVRPGESVRPDSSRSVVQVVSLSFSLSLRLAWCKGPSFHSTSSAARSFKTSPPGWP